MQKLIIIGAAGTGREIAEVVQHINAVRPQWDLLGYLDDDPAKQGKEFTGRPVLGPIAAIGNYPDAQFVSVVASHRDLGRTRRLVERLNLPPGRFATLVHPSANVSRYATIGPGSVILQNCVITVDVTIGSHVLICFSTFVGHDCKLCDYVTIAPNANISGGVQIGEGCYLGANCSVIQGAKIGPFSTVGIGAVILRDVPPNTTAVGNPARLLPRESTAP